MRYKSPGYLVCVDTKHLLILGRKYYQFNAIDCYSKLAYSKVYNSITSTNAADFVNSLINFFPFLIESIQTDNGAEFLGEFDDHLIKIGLTHWFTYPRCPRINGCVERYNRTVQEEFIDQNLDSLLVDKADFNRKLADYIIWYNSKRVHKSLNLKSPLQYLVERWSMSNKSVTYTTNLPFL